MYIERDDNNNNNLHGESWNNGYWTNGNDFDVENQWKWGYCIGHVAENIKFVFTIPNMVVKGYVSFAAALVQLFDFF